MDGSFCEYPCCKLKQARLVAGLSGDSVVQVLGVCRSTVWRYLNGKSRPPRSVCATLAYLSGRLPVPGWETCQINIPEQRLYVDDNRYGIHRKDLRLYFFQLQELRALRRLLVESRFLPDQPHGTTVSRSPLRGDSAARWRPKSGFWCLSTGAKGRRRSRRPLGLSIYWIKRKLINQNSHEFFTVMHRRMTCKKQNNR